MSTSGDLAGQIAELRQRVEAMQARAAARPRIALDPVGPVSYLGQSISVVATVTDQQNIAPRSNVPITLLTTWGTLRGDGEIEEGTSYSAQTGSDGKLRVSLRPGISLTTAEEEDALQAMLSSLDPLAPTPRDATAALQSLAQQYRWEANRDFRSAVDAYFNGIGQKLLHAGELQDYMGVWPLIPVTVVAYVGGAEPAAAILALKIRDWMGPWLQVYRQVLASNIQFDPGLQFVKQNADTPQGFITGVYDHVALTVEREFGDLGKKVAQQHAQKAIGDFLSTGITDLPVDRRLAVAPALATGARSLASAGSTVVSVLGQNHVTAAGAAVTAAANQTAVQDVQGKLQSKANTADVQNMLSAKADLVAVQTLQVKVDSKANVADLQVFQRALDSKVDVTSFQTFQTNTKSILDAKLDASNFQVFSKQVGDKLGLFVTKADLDGMRQTLQTSINAKADQTAFDTFKVQTTNQITAKADKTALDHASQRLGTLETKVIR